MSQEDCQSITKIIKENCLIIESTWILKDQMKDEINGSLDVIKKCADGLREIMDISITNVTDGISRGNDKHE